MTISLSTLRTLSVFGALLLVLPSCDMLKPDAEQKYPQSEEKRRQEKLGKITGDEGLLTLGGPSDKEKDSGKNPLGVNSFLWRATLDTLSFLPITGADPFGGTVLTEWYEAPEAPGERFKVNVLILDRQLRADSLKITTFRQTKSKTGNWVDTTSDAKLGRKLEDTVLTRARELRVKQLGY